MFIESYVTYQTLIDIEDVTYKAIRILDTVQSFLSYGTKNIIPKKI